MQERWKITIEYDGNGYHGWQRQKDGVPSVQQSVEQAIAKFCQQDITIHAAGRTDAGVHAKGQVAHFDLDYGDRELTGFDVLKAINAHLRPQPINVIEAVKVADDFHARFAATNKLYQYRVVCRPAFLTHDVGQIWHCKRDLNVEAMREGAKYLLGHHDFTTFRDSQCQSNSPMKTLDRLDITEKPYDHCGGREITFETEALSFLHHQVRNMVGTLALVGEGKWSPADMGAALAAKDRTKGGPTAPSDGLYLMRVDYP